MSMFSPDGYLHLPRRKLERIPLQHLLSGTDEEPAGPGPRCGSAASLSGYTEWVSPAEPGPSSKPDVRRVVPRPSVEY